MIKITSKTNGFTISDDGVGGQFLNGGDMFFGKNYISARPDFNANTIVFLVGNTTIMTSCSVANIQVNDSTYTSVADLLTALDTIFFLASNGGTGGGVTPEQLNTAIATREPVISAGDQGQYFDGSKTFKDFPIASEDTSGILGSSYFLKILYGNSSIDVGENGSSTVYEEYFDANGDFFIPEYVINVELFATSFFRSAILPDYENDPKETSEQHHGDMVKVKNKSDQLYPTKVTTRTPADVNLRRKIKMIDGSLVYDSQLESEQFNVYKWNHYQLQWEVM